MSDDELLERMRANPHGRSTHSVFDFHQTVSKIVRYRLTTDCLYG